MGEAAIDIILESTILDLQQIKIKDKGSSLMHDNLHLCIESISKRVRKEANVDKKQGKISTFFPPSMTPTKEEHADNVDGK